MAVAVQHDLRRQLRRRIAWHFALEEFTQQECLRAQPIGARVFRQQVSQLVAEH